ncbi:MAG: nucleotidyltransferase domain-containing protein [Chloroflexi bacterium]|nr:nucleotidyltransferase domain-containing protein [Chloroflexota bacterium]
MLTEGAKHQLQPVISALQQHLGPKLIAVVLFGSRARQEHSSESDWDLLLIAEGLPSKAFPRHLFIKRMLPSNWRGKVSVLAKTPSEFEAGILPIYLDIALDGVILYDTNDYVTKRLIRLRRLIENEKLYREQRDRDLIWRWREFPGLGRQLTWEGKR